MQRVLPHTCASVALPSAYSALPSCFNASALAVRSCTCQDCIAEGMLGQAGLTAGQQYSHTSFDKHVRQHNRTHVEVLRSYSIEVPYTRHQTTTHLNLLRSQDLLGWCLVRLGRLSLSVCI